jgi:hypothetical protein
VVLLLESVFQPTPAAQMPAGWGPLLPWGLLLLLLVVEGLRWLR